MTSSTAAMTFSQCGGSQSEASVRGRRCLVFAPTATSALLLAACMFLPFGLYGGCSTNPPQVVSPYQRQVEAIASGDVGGLIAVTLPFALALAVGLATLASCLLSGSSRFLGLWTVYAGLIVLTCVLVVATDLETAWDFSAPRESWRQHSLALLSVFWLLNVVLATWIEAPSRFVGAMLLQWVVVLLILISLVPFLIFLECLLIGGWIVASCALVLPLATGLQLYADPAACRESSLQHANIPSGMPQFTLRGLLGVTTLVAAVLAVGQGWGFEPAVLLAYVATFALLALRPRVRSGLARWYALVACLLAIGGLLAI